MIYDKATGDVEIIDKNAGKKKKILRSVTDVSKERDAIEREIMGNDALDDEQKREQLTEILLDFTDKFDVDPTKFPVFSRDGMRVDIGLLVQRPPIFVKMSPKDIEQMKMRSQVMNEYHVNMKKHADEFEELSKLNEDIMADNPYNSNMNLDNFPTH